MDSARAESMNVIIPPTEDGARAGSIDAAAPLEYQSAADATLESVRAGGQQALKAAAVRSSMWTLTAFALSQVIRFGSVYFLPSFLLPEDFGAANTVGFYIVLLTALSDLGIEQAIIQNKRGDDTVFLNTAWTLHVMRGLVLWLGACLLAYPAYKF